MGLNLFRRGSQGSQSAQAATEPIARDAVAERIPPGQALTEDFPVLTYGATPRYRMDKWTFKIVGLVEQPVTLSFGDILAMPSTKITTDIHCVTAWSMLDTQWEGVRVRDFLALTDCRVKPEAKFVMVHADINYSTNLPFAALLDDDVLLAYNYSGRPLPPEHGGPLRLLVPKLYFWKSAKWVRGFELIAEDRPGFWESYGYHNNGDPWNEERYS
jgi:DMSO/TMAO reductase YedYZ molybdopterin-dependent catalytic subunit